MSCSLSEEELWSGLDRDAPEIAEHVAGCTTCQARPVQMRLELARPEITAQQREVRGDPAVVTAADLQDMGMTVDPHGLAPTAVFGDDALHQDEVFVRPALAGRNS